MTGGVTRTVRGVAGTVRHPVTALRRLAGDGPVAALVILFGLNAVDELDRTAFGVLLPNIRDHFGLDLQGILTLSAVVGVVALGLQIPIAWYADRAPRVRMALVGATAWAVFSFLTGLATSVVALGAWRVGSALGKAVNDPTHNSLLADWFPPASRPRVYSFHRAANAVGQLLGPLAAGLLAFSFGWRAPFLVFAVPTVVLVIAGLRLREPVRGAQERRAHGATAEVVATEEAPPSFTEAWRMVHAVRSLRRIFAAMPFLAAALIGYGSLAALLYEEAFGLDERARGVVAAVTEPVQLVGLIIGARIGTRLVARDPGLILRFVAVVSLVTSALSAAFALAPGIGVAVAVNAAISLLLAIVGPGILASLSLAIPPRARSLGFSITSLWILPGLAILPVIGAIGDALGLRVGMLVMVPVFAAGGLVISTAGNLIASDIAQVWATAAARAELVAARRRGEATLLVVRGLQAGYGPVRVLHGVDLDLDAGAICAIVGTNGAGKSTLVRAIAGVLPPERGAVVLDGRDITWAPAEEIAGHGVVVVPGGAGVFGSLTVAENLRVAAWSARRTGAVDPARVLGIFSELAERLDEPAADLSGGQQQMLALAMALVSEPRVLIVDELSIGLAPVVVASLLEVLRDLRDAGCAVAIVEQSISVALAVADTVVVMEKGRVRHRGPAAELAARPDLLRSVFLAGAADGPGTVRSRPAGEAAGVPGADRGDDRPALECRGITVRFGGLTAVDDVSLAVPTGQVLGLIGPNGAGKTTLFDVLGGTTRADRGRVLFEGTDVTRLGPVARARLGLGRSFQDARLFGSLTVTEVLAVALDRTARWSGPLSAAVRLPAGYDSEHRIAAEVDALIDVYGLGPWRRVPVAHLSTGTRRVVDLAALAAARPRIVLLDEPAAGIAQREVEALAGLLRDLRDRLGATMVVIDHDMPLVAAVADRVVAMDAGRIIADGPPGDVLAHPAVVAAYLGDDPAAVARSAPTPAGAAPPAAPTPGDPPSP